MIEKICNKLTIKIKNKMPEIDDERAEIINYGLQIIIGEIPKTLIIIGIAYMLGVLKLTLLGLLFIAPYKTFSRRSSFKNTYWMYYWNKFVLYRKCNN